MYLSIISLHTSARREYRCPALIDYLFEQGTVLCSHGASDDRCPFCFSFLYTLAYSSGFVPICKSITYFYNLQIF
jgi:hypothetical protein